MQLFASYILTNQTVTIVFPFAVFGLEPSFDVPIINVTVEEGSTAVLPCSVDFLGDHKVNTSLI